MTDDHTCGGDPSDDSSASGAAVLTEIRDRTLVVTLNRPAARNALNKAVVDGLVDAFAQLDEEDGLSVGVLTGSGDGFCSGMDLKAFATEGPPRAMGRLLLHGCRKPLVGAIEGFAMGGGLELALLCDVMVVAEGARLGVPEVGVGLLAAGGAAVRLPGRIPYAVAAEMLLTGDPIDAGKAHAVGLVNAVSSPGRTLEDALGLADRIARNAPLAVAGTKQVLRQVPGRTEDELFEFQKPVVKSLFRSEDAKEGARAFTERRPPRWTAS